MRDGKAAELRGCTGGGARRVLYDRLLRHRRDWYVVRRVLRASVRAGRTARHQLEWLHGRAKATATAWQATAEWWQAYAASSHRRMLWRTRKARKGAAAAAKACEAAAALRQVERQAAGHG